jgi:glyoxylase-like metal-dependent hydrolase (beta-lactamase superfamily II)
MTTIERIPCGNGNCFIIDNGENAILVDTSLALFKDKILQACGNKNVVLIVLTHGHVDHIQNAAFLAKELNAPIAMHQADCPLILDKYAETLLAHTNFGRNVLKVSLKSMEQENVEPFEPNIYLKEGDTFKQYGIPATVIELPGHTKGSIGIKVDNSDIFIGDALMNIFFPTKAPIYGNREIMEQSAKKITSLGKLKVHFGHGKSLSNRKWR